MPLDQRALFAGLGGWLSVRVAAVLEVCWGMQVLGSAWVICGDIVVLAGV
jgi:hypothetical protein